MIIQNTLRRCQLIARDCGLPPLYLENLIVVEPSQASPTVLPVPSGAARDRRASTCPRDRIDLVSMKPAHQPDHGTRRQPRQEPRRSHRTRTTSILGTWATAADQTGTTAVQGSTAADQIQTTPCNRSRKYVAGGARSSARRRLSAARGGGFPVDVISFTATYSAVCGTLPTCPAETRSGSSEPSSPRSSP